MTVRMRHALECRRDDPPWLLVNAALVRFKDGLRFALAARPPRGGLEIHRPDLSKSADRQIQNAPLAIRLSNFDPEQWWQT